MTKEMALIQGSIEKELKEQLDNWLSINELKMSGAVKAMAKLFLALPDETKLDLYVGKRTSGDTLIDIVQRIVDERISSGQQSKRRN